MSRIRAFEEGDIPQVARLHQSVFRPEGRTDPGALDSYQAYFRRVFLDNPFGDASLPSLVCEQDRRIVGFVGRVSRPMAIGRRRFQAAVSSQFIVDPASEAGLVAVRLAKAFLEGPQDLSIADEANDTSRRIWLGLGGAVAPLHSLRWTRPLRPATLAQSFLRNRRGLAPFGVLARPVAKLIDAFATRLPGSQFYPNPGRGSTADLDASVSNLPAALDAADTLHVERDQRAFAWLLARAAETRPGGRLLKTVVREGQTTIGWYIWHLDRRASAEVLELKATSSSIDAVLDHLFHDAWRHGTVSASGRLEPRFAQALSDKYSVFHRRGPWMLFHAKRPELLQAFHVGNVSFSRLDGEWSLAF